MQYNAFILDLAWCNCSSHHGPNTCQDSQDCQNWIIDQYQTSYFVLQWKTGPKWTKVAARAMEHSLLLRLSKNPLNCTFHDSPPAKSGPQFRRLFAYRSTLGTHKGNVPSLVGPIHRRHQKRGRDYYLFFDSFEHRVCLPSTLEGSFSTAHVEILANQLILPKLRTLDLVM